MKKEKINSSPLTDSQRAFVENLIRENQGAIYYIIKAVLGEVYGYLLDDSVGKLYLLTCEKIKIVENHPCPKAWVLVAARVTALYMIKNNRKDLDAVPLERAPVTEVDTTYEEALFGIWLENDVPQKLLNTLTKRETQIYYKLYVENKGTETVAAELGLKVSTVRSFKQLIKDKLREHVNKKI